MGLFKKAKDAFKGEEQEFLIAEHERAYSNPLIQGQ